MDNNPKVSRHSNFSLMSRWLIWFRTWKCKGAARMDQYLWLYWVFTGRYPSIRKDAPKGGHDDD